MSPDRISNLINSHRKGPLSFGHGGEGQLGDVEHVATVGGRSVRVRTQDGEVFIRGQAMIYRTPDGVVSLQGGNTHALSVEDIRRLLPENEANEVINALARDRRKKKLRLHTK